MIETLSSVLTRQASGSLDRARSMARGHDREKLTRLYRSAFATGQRAKAFVLAEALTAHGLPPCFRLAHPPPARPFTVDQQLDLFAHDVQWLAVQYPEQRRAASAKHYQRLFDAATPDEFEWGISDDGPVRSDGFGWLREVEGRFNNGERPRWVIARGLALSERQQWECAWLRSPIVNQKADALTKRRDTVYKAIMAHLPRTSRTMDAEAAKAVLTRRFKVWLCGQMSRDGANVSPAAAARLYAMWTGETIDRGTVGQILKWLNATIPESRNRKHHRAGKQDIAILGG
ncbi:hypothetical protein [Burkholderia ubonensis]|uniref:hypothetical protein n=1 Tax=Burkholderia ubonensis TaxID=101571 RepID=UPI0007566ED4|nr:hypothetical protein [Burkholderia ubonensis]KVD64875.1 hypothetical protein WI88_00265 [Burkholderia ubonensis]